MKKNNVVIFGTGRFYEKHKHKMPKNVNIVAFIDNDENKSGKFIDGVLVYNPRDVENVEYDAIVLASAEHMSMKSQLLEMGVAEHKIMFWEKFLSVQSRGVLEKFDVISYEKENGKKCLIIVPIINLAGGFLAALYVALSLKKLGCDVTIAAPSADEQALKETNSHGISVWLCPSLLYIDNEELQWINQFDFIWSNSLQTMICVDKIKKIKPVIWWLHEYKEQYEDCVARYEQEVEDKCFNNVNIYAVSEIAKKNFLDFFNASEVEVMTFGMPDFNKKCKNNSKDKIIVAVIGAVTKMKNQKELVRVISRLPQELANRVECWIIGRNSGKYGEELNEYVQEVKNVKVLGEVSRDKLQEVFQNIDIVVCSSLEETMCATIVEGMMNSKICITTTNTGISYYIEDGKNGFVYPVGEQEVLYQKLIDIINDMDELENIRINARQTYEKYFSMDVFENKIKSVTQQFI